MSDKKRPFNEKDLLAKGFVPDGKGGYHLPPKELERRKAIREEASTVIATMKHTEIGYPLTPDECFAKRKLTLTLFGVPMAKQSVRSANGHFWQPAKYVERKKDYIKQILEQLPADFKMFEYEVHLKKFHCVFPPLKKFHSIKGRMEAIRNGEIFYKNSKPDLDNCQKLIFDSLSELVFKDDSLIVSMNDVKKVFGTGGCIIIELEGY